MSLLDYWETRRSSVKRRRVADDAEEVSSVSSCQNVPCWNGENALSNSDPSVLAAEGEIAVEDEPPFSNSQTELESTLPAIEPDTLTVEGYERLETVDDVEEPDFLQRLQEGKWRKGKSSIYVDAFNLALQTVLDEEAHLFNEAEMELFRQWRGMSYQSQYLYVSLSPCECEGSVVIVNRYVRLFLRKTSAWHRINQLGYYSDVTDLPMAVADLQCTRCLPTPCEPENANPEDAQSELLSGEFGFADSSVFITSLEEASSLLLLEELKGFAKEARVQGKSKKELIAAFRQSSQTQRGLDWNGDKTASMNRDVHFVQKILDYTGECIRLSSGPRALFERVHLVFYRSTEWTEKSLTTIILAKMSRKNFPEYIVCRSNSIFPSRATLLEFESALRTQFQIDNILQFNGTPGKEGLQQIKDLCDAVYPRWKTMLEQEQQKEDNTYECEEGGPYLRRFSPAWVYTRIVHKGLLPLGRFKEHKREHQVLSELLSQRLFHPARRGAWYQRKALLEEHYMWTLMPTDDRNESVQKKHWKNIALQTCETGLEDPDCHLIYHYDLQKRTTKLEKALRIPKREQHDFGYAVLAKPEERTVEGTRIEQSTPPNGGPEPSTRRGRATTWLDEREGEEVHDSHECRVEQMCLNWYLTHGWKKGYHSEGGILRTLFSYLFYDILFTYVPNVFQTPFQTCPLDLHTDAFYPTRASEINYRLVEITNGAAPSLIGAVHARESPSQPCVVGINWSFPLDDVVEVAECFRGEALAAICKVFAQEYQQRGGGIPDLVVWDPGRKEVGFVEVKSENDRLSDTQRLWIHVLVGVGVRVEVCNAVARDVIVRS